MLSRSIKLSLYHLKAWSKGLAPYIVSTLTLKRILANRSLRMQTRCKGIDEYFAINVNGSKQWLRVRGEYQTNPVILYLHGGPGGSQIPSYRHYQLDWEKEFTIVHWEQRGAGKSYNRSLELQTLTLGQLVEDTLSVIDYLSTRFGRDDIILLGHSWGSLLAIHVLQKRTLNIGAYIGVGQVSNQIASEHRMYQFTLDSARADFNQDAIDQLSSIEGYPLLEGTLDTKVALVRYWARHYGFLGSNINDYARTYQRLTNTPEYGLLDVYRFLKGTLVCSATLGRTLFSDQSAQPTNLSRHFNVPFFLVSGRRDHFTPTDFANDYFDSIEAPVKRHVVFEESGHYPNEDEPERFINVVRELVEPHVARANK